MRRKEIAAGLAKRNPHRLDAVPHDPPRLQRKRDRDQRTLHIRDAPAIVRAATFASAPSYKAAVLE